MVKTQIQVPHAQLLGAERFTVLPAGWTSRDIAGTGIHPGDLVVCRCIQSTKDFDDIIAVFIGRIMLDDVFRSTTWVVVIPLIPFQGPPSMLDEVWWELDVISSLREAVG